MKINNGTYLGGELPWEQPKPCYFCEYLTNQDTLYEYAIHTYEKMGFCSDECREHYIENWYMNSVHSVEINPMFIVLKGFSPRDLKAKVNEIEIEYLDEQNEDGEQFLAESILIWRGVSGAERNAVITRFPKLEAYLRYSWLYKLGAWLI